MSSSRKRSFKQYMPVSDMSTAKLKRLAAGYQARQAASAVRNRAPRIKGPINARQELKFVDTAAANYGCDTTGSVTPLNLLAIGDDYNTRDGRQVTIKSVQLKGLIKPTGTSTTNNKARVMLVWDNANNGGSGATIAQILSASSSYGFPLVNNAQRFTILMDRTYAVGFFGAAATASPVTYDLEFYKKMNAVVQYSDTTAAITSIQNGALLLVTIGDQVAASGSVATISARVRFVDN